MATVKILVLPLVATVASYLQIQMVKYDRFESMHGLVDCLFCFSLCEYVSSCSLLIGAIPSFHNIEPI